MNGDSKVLLSGLKRLIFNLIVLKVNQSVNI